MITVLVVDDNGPIRKSLRYLLATADDMKLAATATNGVGAIEKARSLSPDIAVIDVSMPILNGLEATEQIRECCRLTRVILFSIYDQSEYIQQALEAGAKGYVLKDSAGEELLDAIRAVHQGRYYFSHQIAEIAENHLSNGESDRQTG